MLICTKRKNQCRGAYSSRYTALATPTGTARAAVSRTIHNEPTSADFTPASAGKREG